MNPHSASKQKLKSYLKSGINRLSIGVQSFNNTSLKKLGRIHCKQDAINTFYTSREIGFKNINIDIMHSLPDQSLNMSIEDLQQTIQLKPEHISWYELTLEPNTYFAKYPPRIPHEELKEQIYFAGIEILQAHGFNQYEISAYSKTKKNTMYSQ